MQISHWRDWLRLNLKVAFFNCVKAIKTYFVVNLIKREIKKNTFYLFSILIFIFLKKKFFLIQLYNATIWKWYFYLTTWWCFCHLTYYALNSSRKNKHDRKNIFFVDFLWWFSFSRTFTKKQFIAHQKWMSNTWA